MRLPVDPTSYALRAPFGRSREYYNFTIKHTGQDFSGQYNRRVYAAHGGKVTSGYDDRNGYYLVIDNGKYRSSYLHLKKGSKRVKQNETVSEGKWIATMGTTGKSTGVHLHWSLRVNGKLVDPMNYINKGDDMYKGKSAKYWNHHAIKLHKARDKWKAEANKIEKHAENLHRARDALREKVKKLESENAALKSRVTGAAELNKLGEVLAAVLKTLGFKREEK